jgi:hypothetical protein
VLGESQKNTKTLDPVDIPIWISRRAMPKNGASINAKQFKESGAEIWLSITELRRSNLKDQLQGHDRRRMIMANGHDYEWLALGRIPESRIVKVMPWDGETLHICKSIDTVYSKSSAEPWIYDWDLESWRLDPTLFADTKQKALQPFKPMRHNNNKKRKRVGNADSDEVFQHYKAPRMIEFKIVRPYYKPQALPMPATSDSLVNPE